MNEAVIKDIEKQYVEAVSAYEKIINGSSFPDIDCFVNLAFLYWSFVCEQMEFNEPNNISDEWSLVGGEKFLQVLDKGLENYPNSLELIFWRSYLPSRLGVCDFSENDCKSILEQYEIQDSLVPYFFLNIFDKKAYLEEINELRNICKELPTAKNLYINSFLL